MEKTINVKVEVGFNKSPVVRRLHGVRRNLCLDYINARKAERAERELALKERFENGFD